MAKRVRIGRLFDHRQLTDRLDRARSHQLLVTIRSRWQGAPTVVGFVTGLGRQWVAVSVLDDRLFLDGTVALRLEDVLVVSIEPDPDCFEVLALRARFSWPIPPGPLVLDDTISLIKSVAEVSSMFGLSVVNPSSKYLFGRIVSVDRGFVRLRRITNRATWSPSIKAIPLPEITRVSLGGEYDAALTLIAGPESGA